MNELFPADTVTQLSPRLLWMKKHQVRVHCAEFMKEDPEEEPYCVWLPANDAFPEVAPDSVPNDPTKCGYGKTEEEALVALAKLENIPLWNEEDVSK
jgi:hypothetical protein